MTRHLLGLGMALVVGATAGCGGSSDAEDASRVGGSGGELTGGNAGATDTGGTPAASGGASTGGNAQGGSGGELAGGRGGAVAAGGSDTGGGGSGTTGGSAGAPAGGTAGALAGGSAGSPTGGSTSDPTGGSAGSSRGGAGGSGGDGASGSATGGGGGQGGAACDALSQAISAETSGVHACTAVVRLAYETRAILGFQLLCAPYDQVDEAAARQTADGDTGYGLNGTLLSGADPEDEYVFYEPPGDFGGVGVVSARNGTTVFGGSIIWSGTGEITYPTTWRPASEIGPDCIPQVNALPPTARGIDLSGGQEEMEQTQVDAAMNEVWATALPDGMWRNQYVFDAMVLLYPRSVGMMNPATAEWIVLLNFGWLE